MIQGVIDVAYVHDQLIVVQINAGIHQSGAVCEFRWNDQGVYAAALLDHGFYQASGFNLLFKCGHVLTFMPEA